MRSGRLCFVLCVIAAGCSGGDHSKPSDGARGTGGATSAGDGSVGSGGGGASVGTGDAATAGTDAAISMHTDGGALALDAALPQAVLTGLVPTSGSHVVFTSQPIEDFRDYPPSSLYALDLKNGKVHDLNAGGSLSYTSASPDQSTLFCSGANAANDSNLLIVRLTDQGVVPAIPITGFAGRPGNEYLRGWTGDGRYAIFERGSNLTGDGVDVVDTHTNALLWYADNPQGDQTANITVAPKGPWFAYWLGIDKREAALARIEPSGVTTMKLPTEGYSFVFDAEGKRVAYVDYDAPNQLTKLVVRTLGGAAQPLGDPAGYPAANVGGFMRDDDRVFATLYVDPSSTASALELLSISGADPVVLSDPTRSPTWTTFSADFSALLIAYSSPSSQDLEFVDPAGSAAAIPVGSYPADVGLGIRAIDDQRFLYSLNVDLPLATDAELHLVQQDGKGGVLDTKLNMPDEVAIGCLGTNPGLPVDKLVFMELKTHTFELIDLSGKDPERVATIAPSLADATEMFCPVWGPNGDAFAYTEMSATSTRIRLVRWSGGTPEPVETVYEADAAVEVVVARP